MPRLLLKGPQPTPHQQSYPQTLSNDTGVRTQHNSPKNTENGQADKVLLLLKAFLALSKGSAFATWWDALLVSSSTGSKIT